MLLPQLKPLQCIFTYIQWKKNETSLPFFSPMNWENMLPIPYNHDFFLFILHFRYSFLMRISFPHHVFHSKSSCFLLYLAFYFIMDFILLQTVAQTFNFLGYDIQSLFGFYVYFILCLICSRNRQEALSFTVLLLKHSHIIFAHYLWAVFKAARWILFWMCTSILSDCYAQPIALTYIKILKKKKKKGNKNLFTSLVFCPLLARDAAD